MAAPPEWPASLKAIKPYMQRARELEASQPLVSYYCNLYALQRGIRERDATDETAADFIKGLLTKCEGLRGRFAADADAHRWQVEEFAIGVFESAEAVYFAGTATAATAQHFFAAMCFLDVCTQFAPLTEDLARSRGKARLFAGLIRKDVRAGRPLLPPEAAVAAPPASSPESDEAELEREMNKLEIPPAPQVEQYGAPGAARANPDFVSSSTASTMYGMHGFTDSTGSAAPPSAPLAPPSPPGSWASQPPAAAPPSSWASQPPAPAPPSPSPQPPTAWQPTAPAPPTPPAPAPAAVPAPAAPRAAVPGFQPTTDGKSQAQRKAKFAISALDFNDVPTAISNLTAALELLTGSAP